MSHSLSKLPANVAMRRLRAERSGKSTAEYPQRVRKTYAPYGSQKRYVQELMVNFNVSRVTAWRIFTGKIPCPV